MDFGNWLLLQKIRGGGRRRSRQIFKSYTSQNFFKKYSRVEWKMRNDDDDECGGWEHRKKLKKKNENRLWTITKE